MAERRSLSDLTREQLYELVWSTPASKLAEQFGVSDVAIAKHCKKLAVPRPERGYWAKLEFGKKVFKPALPPSPVNPCTEETRRPLPPSTSIPAEDEPLHPLAARFLTAIRESKLSYDRQRVHLEVPELPDAKISKVQAPRAARAVHALLNFVEPRGILFKKSRSKYDGGCLRKGNDDLHLKIEEELVDAPEPIGRRRTNYSSWQHDNKIACGCLTFTLNPNRYERGAEKRWRENDKTPLETIIAEMAKAICQHFAEFQRKREAEVIERKRQQLEAEARWKKQQEEEAIRRQEAAKRQHAETLEKVIRSRQEDLLKAGEWWRLFRDTEDFIAECERRWKESAEPSSDQRAWLAWARGVLKGISPFESGYPDPARDGTFDPAAVPFGGPYPAKREFSQPPTMPQIPAPVVLEAGHRAINYQPADKPYPFWLKHQPR